MKGYPSELSYRLSVLSRIIAGAFGAYILVNLSNLALSYLLPTEQYKGLLLAMMLSFIFYTIAVIWVFSVRTATRAWLGLLIIALPLSAINIFVYLRELGL